MLGLLFVVPDTSYAGWREGLSSIGRRIQSGTRRAIDWGAEKFKPAFKRVQKVSEDGTQRNYDRAIEAKDDPAGFARDAVVEEVAGDARSGAEAARHLKDGNLQDAANVGCKTTLNPPVPFAGQAAEPYTDAICDEVFPPTGKDTGYDAAAAKAENDFANTVNKACEELKAEVARLAAIAQDEFRRYTGNSAAISAASDRYTAAVYRAQAKYDAIEAQAKATRDAAIARAKQ